MIIKDYLGFVRFLKPHKGLLALSVVFMAISSLFDWVSIAMIVPVADKVFNNGKIIFPVKLPETLSKVVSAINDISQVKLFTITVFIIPVLFFLKGLFNFLYSYYMSDIGQLCVRDIRNRVYEKLQALSLEYFTRKRAGELISRITNDVKLVENALSYGTTDLVYQSFLVIIFTLTIFFISWKLALITFLLVPLIMFPIVKVGKVLRKISRTSQEKMADINSLLIETISGVRIVKAFCMENYEINKFKGQNQGYYKLSMKSIKRTLILSPVTEFVGVLFGVLILAWVGKDVIAGKISFGVLGWFLGSLFSLIRPLKRLSQVNSIIQQALAANTRIYEVLETPIMVKEKGVPLELGRINPPTGISGLQPEKECDYAFLQGREPRISVWGGSTKKVEFKNVSFKYEDALVLEDINLSVEVGEVAAFVGPSGSGKSTLVDLIPRFYDPQIGNILVDGKDIRDVSLKSLRSQIGIVTQETVLFNDTIKANISYGHMEAENEKIIGAAKIANAHDFIIKLPKGYDTFIGDRGVKLSGGERQRLAIARALLKNSPILILDEATSQLDTESERIVQDALDKLMKGRTVFVVAHRLSTVKNAAKIIVLEKGKVVQSGTHQQLVNLEGLYRRLYSIQNLNSAKV